MKGFIVSVSILECTTPDELFVHYHGQSAPQPAYIELDTQHRTLSATYDAEVGNAVPFSVRHGLDRRYGIPILTAEAANRVMREIAPLADRIIDGTEVEWDGNNNVAVLDDDAVAAEEEIEKLLGLPSQEYGDRDAPNQGFPDSDIVAVWDIEGATNGCEVDDYDITATTTDDRLDEIEQEILDDLVGAGESSVVVCHGLDDYLRGLRDELAEEDPLTPAELRTAREALGLTGEQMAKLFQVNPRTVRAWEQGRDSIPGRLRLEVAKLQAETVKAVAEVVAGVQGQDDPVLITYRSDEEYLASSPRGRWSASWHRQVCARAAEQTGARIDYADEED